MGSITRTLANNITTGGVILPSGINNTSLSSVTALPAGVGGSMVKLAVNDATSLVSSVSFDGYFSSTYKNYVLYMTGYRPNFDGQPIIRFNVSGTEQTGSNYRYAVGAQYANNSGGQGTDYTVSGASPVGYIRIITANNNASDLTPCNHIINIFNPLSSSYKHFTALSQNVNASNADWYADYASGFYENSSALSGITIKELGSNSFKGYFALYGVTS